MKFSKCSFIKSAITGIDWTGVSTFDLSLKFEHCSVNYCLFQDLQFTSFKLIDSTAQETDFINCNLIEAKFNGSDLKDTGFIRCNLQKADFRRAVNYALNPNENKLKKTFFSLPDALFLINHFEILLDGYNEDMD